MRSASLVAPRPPPSRINDRPRLQRHQKGHPPRRHHTGSLPGFDIATGEPAYTVNAIDAETRESWLVTADDALAAWTELAALVGIELMD